MLIDRLAAFCLVIFCFFGIIFLLQRARWRSRKRRGKKRWGYYPSTATLGNALQTLQAISQPSVEHVLEEKLDEPAEDDDSGGSDDPIAHLHRQGEKIRRGNLSDQLTTKLKPRK